MPRFFDHLTSHCHILLLVFLLTSGASKLNKSSALQSFLITGHLRLRSRQLLPGLQSTVWRVGCCWKFSEVGVSSGFFVTQQSRLLVLLITLCVYHWTTTLSYCSGTFRWLIRMVLLVSISSSASGVRRYHQHLAGSLPEEPSRAVRTFCFPQHGIWI